MSSFTPRQAQLLAAIQQIQEREGTENITLERIVGITGISKENASRILTSIRALYPNDRDRIVQSTHFHGKTIFWLNGAVVATTRFSAEMVIRAAHYTRLLGSAPRIKFKMEMLQSDALDPIDKTEEFIDRKLDWALRDTVGYLKIPPGLPDNIASTSRVNDELNFLDMVASQVKKDS